VFLELAGGKTLRVGGRLRTPGAVKGSYHAIFRTARGDECMVSIDPLLDARRAEGLLASARSAAGQPRL